MKRDLELIRSILKKLEEETDGFHPVDVSDQWVTGYTKHEIVYHLILMHEGGLVKGDETTTLGVGVNGMNFMAFRLTWEGHEFLDSIRDDNLWNKLKSSIQNVTSSISYASLKHLAIEATKQIVIS